MLYACSELSIDKTVSSIGHIPLLFQFMIKGTFFHIHMVSDIYQAL